MCLNCGCGMADDTMGNDANITTATLAKAAIASSQNGADTLRNLKAGLNLVKGEDIDKKVAEIKEK